MRPAVVFAGAPDASMEQLPRGVVVRAADETHAHWLPPLGWVYRLSGAGGLRPYVVVHDQLTSTQVEGEECSASVSDKLSAGGGWRASGAGDAFRRSRGAGSG
ncbi:hypothetical protein GCM10010156_68090 [Planobispora rosea]|uniref:Uncharacterized protein n=1 Tax=Planobispora rosea TaxID=35762 RepID=A0A8J3SAN7_PLARO|nr:hypothetical protein GCM10010156_68090 [Planobispora rosea]GIH88209.1 hypothetical protein Pro02_66170 [Planobispora rosea]